MSESTVGIFVQDIDTAIRNKGFSTNYVEQRVLNVKTVLTAKQQKAYAELQALDDVYRQAGAKVKAARAKFDKALHRKPFCLDTKRAKDGWNVFVVRETYDAAVLRVNGNTAVRTALVVKLRDLRDRVLRAADAGTSLAPLMDEFKTLVKARDIED
jgi:hypothetical protein